MLPFHATNRKKACISHGTNKKKACSSHGLWLVAAGANKKKLALEFFVKIIYATPLVLLSSAFLFIISRPAFHQQPLKG